MYYVEKPTELCHAGLWLAQQSRRPEFGILAAAEFFVAIFRPSQIFITTNKQASKHTQVQNCFPFV
jgi:hypothetical protein